MTERTRLTDADCACEFCLAGNARITLQSAKTGARFTYRVRKAEDKDDLWFVSVLTGQNNESDYAYMGIIRGQDQAVAFRGTQKSRITSEAPSFKAFDYFVRQVLEARNMPEQLEVYHEGRCGRCGRVLTVPESIERGIGPECATRM